MLDVAPWQHSKRCVTALQIFRYMIFCAVKVDIDIYRVSGLSCPEAGAVNQLFFEVFLMFLACLDHARWAKFHLGILGPQE